MDCTAVVVLAIQVGDEIILRPKPVGTLVLDALLPGKRLWLLATGTGIAPYASLIRDPETYERYEEVVLMHTCRGQTELAYGRELVALLAEDPLTFELTRRNAGTIRAMFARTVAAFSGVASM
mgnify:CR=1 FL=1